MTKEQTIPYQQQLNGIPAHIANINQNQNANKLRHHSLTQPIIKEITVTERQVVFVDPEDANAPFWWPAMVKRN